MKTVAISGGFDPLHIGHIRMIQEAAKLGDKLIVILNNDNWLKKKKGYTFYNQEERKEILLGTKGVNEVVITSHPENCEDMSVCKALQELKPAIFANGGDRKSDNVPEVKLCNDLGIELV